MRLMSDGTIDWSAVQACYGPATPVPSLLNQLASSLPSERSEAISELWGCLCHQGTVYEASAIAVPFLYEAAKTLVLTGADRDQLLALIVHIGLGEDTDWKGYTSWDVVMDCALRSGRYYPTSQPGHWKGLRKRGGGRWLWPRSTRVGGRRRRNANPVEGSGWHGSGPSPSVARHPTWSRLPSGAETARRAPWSSSPHALLTRRSEGTTHDRRRGGGANACQGEARATRPNGVDVTTAPLVVVSVIAVASVIPDGAASTSGAMGSPQTRTPPSRVTTPVARALAATDRTGPVRSSGTASPLRVRVGLVAPGDHCSGVGRRRRGEGMDREADRSDEEGADCRGGQEVTQSHVTSLRSTAGGCLPSRTPNTVFEPGASSQFRHPRGVDDMVSIGRRLTDLRRRHTQPALARRAGRRPAQADRPTDRTGQSPTQKPRPPNQSP